jgi:hypothetical protein
MTPMTAELKFESRFLPLLNLQGVASFELLSDFNAYCAANLLAKNYE